MTEPLPSSQRQKDRQPFTDTAEVIERVRSQVEIALKEVGYAPTGRTAKFRGKLSTVPELVAAEVDYLFLDSECVDASVELADALIRIGLHTQPSSSTYFSHWNRHSYLLTEEQSVEIIIDPTIGQYIRGHNHTFVGTREQLREMVCQQT